MRRVRLRRHGAGLLGRPLRGRQGHGRGRLLRQETRDCSKSTTSRSSPSAPTWSARPCWTRSTPGTRAILPGYVWGDGNPDGVNQRAIEEMKQTARAAQRLGVDVVNGFTGSSIWHLLYSFPPVPQGHDRRRLQAAGRAVESDPRRVRRVRREVRPGSPSDRDRLRPVSRPSGRSRRSTAARSSASTSIPSHLLWQGVDPVEFIRRFGDRIYHVHMKDAIVKLDGRTGILSSHLELRQPAPRLGLPLAGPRRREFRGDHPRAERRRLHRPAVGRMGRQRHGPRPRRRAKPCEFVRRHRDHPEQAWPSTPRSTRKSRRRRRGVACRVGRGRRAPPRGHDTRFGCPCRVRRQYGLESGHCHNQYRVPVFAPDLPRLQVKPKGRRKGWKHGNTWLAATLTFSR